jgi:DNA helicase-2/ATP-dependent DNA helicase PcrA
MAAMTLIERMPDPPVYLDRLNPAQRAAVLHGGGAVSGPLLIIAGAGTGKTNTLVHRLAHLVLQGGDPRRILLMTFSRRAAAEMARRAERIAGEVLGPKASVLTEGLVWAGTFHAIGARLLREHAPLIGIEPDFSIHDREDSADLMNLARHRLGLSRTEKRFPSKGTCLAIYSRTVNAQAELPEVLRAHFPWCAGWEPELRALFAAYVVAKQDAAVLDYDDLLLCWAAMMQEPDLAGEIGARFDHVLVDEYQDTNRIQADILAGLKPEGAGVTVVGDDAQSIYAFRAAEVRNILDFPARFTPPARVVTLQQNYRSTPEILAAANAILTDADEGYAKSLWSARMTGARPYLVAVRDETGQVDYICHEILAARETGTALKQQAVLFRTAHHSGPLEVELTRRDIPFKKFGGLKFLDVAHVKDLLGCLRFAQNPRDRIAGFRTLQLMPGVGPATAEATLDALDASRDPAATLAAIGTPNRATAAWPAFVALFVALRAGALGWPGELEAVRTWYEPQLERLHEDFAMRRSDLLQLEQIADGYSTRERFLTDITLDPPSATSDQAGVPHRDDDYLILSTIHSAKGQEWRQVFVLNCVDGCIPSDLGTGTSAEIEEERRLFYVAMTRARDQLHLMQPLRFYTRGQSRHGDRHVYAARTRFLPDRILDRLEPAAWPTAASYSRSGTLPGSRQIDVKRMLRDRWR